MAMKIPIDVSLPKGVEIRRDSVDINSISKSVRNAVFREVRRFMKLIKTDTLTIWSRFVDGYSGVINWMRVENFHEMLDALGMEREEFEEIFRRRVESMIHDDDVVIIVTVAYFPEVRKKGETTDEEDWRLLAIGMRAMNEIIMENLDRNYDIESD